MKREDDHVGFIFFKEKSGHGDGRRTGDRKGNRLGFARYGADIVAIDLSDEKLQSLKNEIEAQDRRCLTLKVDLGQTAQIQEMVKRTVKEMGRIDILANIAGVNVHKAAEDMSEQDWGFVQDINLKALFFCCQAVGKVMLKQGSGKIINMSSSFGMVGFGGRTAYASSKAGVSNLTKTLALEWSSRSSASQCPCSRSRLDGGKARALLQSRILCESD